MTKNGKYFTFLFSRKFRSRIFIKRIEVSRGLLQNSLLGLVLGFSFMAFGVGIYGLANNSTFSNSFLTSSISGPPLNQTAAQVPVQTTQIDYSRPDSFDSFSINSGGPYSTEDLNSEDQEVEAKLRLIQNVSDQATIPSIWAHLGKINNEYGFRRSPFGGRSYEFHAGMDIDGERGDLVVAPANGTVTEAGWKGGYGNMVEIDHGNGLVTRYGHLSRVEVQAGDTLSRGQLMGYVGSTGRSTGPHLHYELRLGEKPINPRRFLPPEPTDIKKPE